MSDREKLAFGLMVAAVVIVPGLSAALINELGAPTLGSVVWVIGYGSGIFAIWYTWLRPLDIRGPTAGESGEPDGDR